MNLNQCRPSYSLSKRMLWVILNLFWTPYFFFLMVECEPIVSCVDSPLDFKNSSWTVRPNSSYADSWTPQGLPQEYQQDDFALNDGVTMGLLHFKPPYLTNMAWIYPTHSLIGPVWISLRYFCHINSTAIIYIMPLRQPVQFNCGPVGDGGVGGWKNLVADVDTSKFDFVHYIEIGAANLKEGDCIVLDKLALFSEWPGNFMIEDAQDQCWSPVTNAPSTTTPIPTTPQQATTLVPIRCQPDYSSITWYDVVNFGFVAYHIVKIPQTTDYFLYYPAKIILSGKIMQPHSWFDAYKACQNICGILTSIQNTDELNYLLVLAWQTVIQRAWVGGAKYLTSPLFTWVEDGSLVSDQLWAQGEPNDAGGPNRESCTDLSVTQLGLNDLSCSYESPFICKTSPSQVLPSCGSEADKSVYYSVANFGVVQYVLVKMTEMSWYDAVEACRAHCGQFLTFRSVEERDFFIFFMQQSGIQHAWIGARRNANGGPFWWIDDYSQVDNSLWALGEPNNGNGVEYCCEISGDGSTHGMNDYMCTEKLPFFCQI